VALIAAITVTLVGPLAPSASAFVLSTNQGLVWGHPVGSSPRAVSLGEPYPLETIEAGDFHGLGISYTGGVVLAWGDNLYGQLGDGTATDRPVSGITIARLPADRTYVQVAAGTGHSLALTADGQLWAWGHNNHGQLGDGTTTDRHQPVRVDVPSDTRVVAIAAGGDHSLALTFDGHVLAWGDNGYGQLGDGSTVDRHLPVRLDLQARSLTAGVHHSAAILVDGTVAAWGMNVDGELGDGTHTNRSVPVDMHLPIDVHATAIDAGGFHTLVIGDDGFVYASGANVNGQLGDDSHQGHRETPVRVHLPAGESAVDVAGGGGHSLALTDSGRVYGWGLNAEGQIDDGDVLEHRAPVAIPLPLTPGVTSVSAGGGQSMATTPQFSDVTAGNPFVTDVSWLFVRKITRGLVDGSFHPQQAVSRRAMATYLYRMLHAGEDTDACDDGAPFPDVPAESYFCGAITWLTGMGITHGYGDGRFRPLRAVSRQEMAAFLYRLSDAGFECHSRPYPDVPVDSPFCGPIRFVDAIGVTHGYPDGSYRPTSLVTRQVMAAYLHRFDDALHPYGAIVDPLGS
jgi:alpha-tubulin suppressor-like RCC1 family protein